VPDTAPPYDDMLRGSGRLRVVADPAARGDQPASAGRSAEAGRRPVIGAWPSQFAQVLAETLAGTRPPEQLAPWTTEQARERISQLGPLLATAHRPRVRRVIVTCPTRGVLEMTVIVGLGSQVRAIALRLERANSPLTPDSEARMQEDKRRVPEATQWLCTAIEAA
jgi:uncharacterized protein DUF6459